MAARRPPGIFEHASLLSEGSANAGGQMWMLLTDSLRFRTAPSDIKVC